MTLSLYDLTVAQLAPLAEAAINEWRSIEGQITLATPTSPDTDSPAILRALQLARLQALRTAEDMLGRLRRKHEETEEATRAKIAETMPSRSPCGVHGCTRPPNHAGPHNTAQPDAPPDPPPN